MGELRNPYVGPRPFEPGEKLYGRGREERELFHMLKARRIVLLHSPSGAGKTSLVQAALLKRLVEDRFDVWPTVRLNLDPEGRTANRFVASTIASLEGGVPEGGRRDLADVLGLRLAEYVKGRPRGKDAPESVVLFFDQFEEVLTVDPVDRQAKEGFFAQLGETLRDPRVWALFAVREDFLAALTPYRDLVPTKLANTYRIDLLERAAAREAIVETARDGGRELTAAEQLLDDLATMQVQQPDGSFATELGQYVEPVQLQVTCLRLWAAMPEDDLSIDAEDLDRFGDVDGALADYYRTCIQRIAGGDDRRERAIREWFGEQLITAGGIRGQVLREAGISGGLENNLIERLLDTHLVRAEKRAERTWYELAHDRLLGPLRKDNEAWREQNLSKVQKEASLWKREGRPSGLLFLREELAKAERWVEENEDLTTEVELEFLVASRTAHESVEREHRLIEFARTLTASALLANGRETWGNLATLEIREPEKIPTATTTLHKALATHLTTIVLTGHKDVVEKSFFSPDGRRILTASRDWTARIWNAETGEELRTLAGHKGSVVHAAWSRGGRRVLTASRDHTARIWDADSGKELHTLSGHKDYVVHAVWSGDGRRVLTASRDNTSRIWNADTGEEIHNLSGHENYVYRAAWSGDGRRVLTASRDYTARIWDAETGKEIHTLAGHGHSVFNVAWSYDSRRALTASRDHTARIWNAETGEEIHILSGHNGSILCAQWSSDDRRVLTASGDHTARIWNAETGEEILILSGHHSPVFNAAWSDDGRRVLTASGDHTARIWNAHTGEEIHILTGHEDSVLYATWREDGRQVLTASRDCTARVCGADTGEEIHTLSGHDKPIFNAVWSSDGRRVVTASMDCTVRIWNADTGEEICILSGHEGYVFHAAWRGDGRRVLTASKDHTARIWAADTGEGIHILSGHDGWIDHAAWRGDGRRVLTASRDRTARVWDAECGEEIHIFSGHEDSVVHGAWRGDGRRALTASWDKTARIWDAETGEEVHILSGHEDSVVHAAWSDDGRRVLTASRDRTTRIWDAETGEEIHVLSGHEASVVHAAWRGDGRRVLTASSDKTARIWDADTGEEVHILSGHQDSIVHAAWRGDGRRVLTASWDKTARIWDADTGEEIHTLSGHRNWVVHAVWSSGGRRVLTASRDKTARIWVAGGTAHLQGRIRARTRLCLPVDVRKRSLGEPQEEAERQAAACEARVPAFFDRLEGVPRGAVEPYVEAWREYRSCLDEHE